MLSASDIGKAYATPGGGLVVLRNVTLRLAAGESAAIVGPSGSGKSTLLHILGTLEPPSSGRVRLGEVDPFTLAPRQLAAFRNEHIGFVFQDAHLLPQCTVLENVLVPTLVRRRAPERAAGDAVLRRATELLDRVGLADRQAHLPAELSGGEKQRVALARALIQAPRVVLADEPTGNLDRAAAERVGDLLAALPGASGVIVIVVTHSPALAARFGRQFELVDGELVPGPAAGAL